MARIMPGFTKAQRAAMLPQGSKVLSPLLADAVVVIHFLWILFIIFGGFWGRKYRWVRHLHIAALLGAACIEITGWYCPLTLLEVWLRIQSPSGLGYSDPFVVHYLERLIYVAVDRRLIVLLTLLVCGVNGWFYFGRRR